MGAGATPGSQEAEALPMRGEPEPDRQTALTSVDMEKSVSQSPSAPDSIEVAIPHNRLILVLPSLALVIFIASMEQSVIGTILPIIGSELNASPLQYAWVGSGYWLSAVVILPVIGRASDILGRKPVLYGFLGLFFVSSALCGAAKNMAWLICARAFQGLGAGAMTSLVFIITSDIIPVHKRAMFQGFVNIAYTMAGAIAPVVGGAFAERVSWRWSFYVTLPICGVATFCLFFTLNLTPVPRKSWSEVSRSFDFVGLLLVTTGAGLLTAGFSIAPNSGFGSKAFIGMVVGGGCCLILTVFHTLRTTRHAIIPKCAFTVPTAGLFLLTSVFSSSCLSSSFLLMPQLFQGVRGSSLIQSGVEVLPLTISISGSGVIAGIIVSKTSVLRPVAWFGLCLMAVGFGLAYALFRYPLPYAAQEIVQLVIAIGMGSAIMTPLLAMQQAAPVADLGAITGAFVLSRAFGANLGIAVLLPVFSSGLESRLSSIPGYGSTFSLPDGTSGYASLHQIADTSTRDAVLTAFAEAMRVCWLIMMCFSLVALVCSIPTRLPKKPQDAAIAPENAVSIDIEQGSNIEKT